MTNSVRETREKVGLSMADLGALLGVNATSISSLERNERDGTAKIGTIERALEAMGYRRIGEVVAIDGQKSVPGDQSGSLPGQ